MNEDKISNIDIVREILTNSKAGDAGFTEDAVYDLLDKYGFDIDPECDDGYQSGRRVVKVGDAFNALKAAGALRLRGE